MKRLSLLLLGIALLTSCEQDSYDKGDSSASYVRADFVEAFVDSDKKVNYVVTDDDVRLTFANAYSSSWIQKADTVYRALMYYNLIDSKTELLSLQRVGTMTIKTDSLKGKNVKTDPVGLEATWMSRNKKYLNLDLILKVGIDEGEESKKQTIGVVLTQTRTNADGTMTSCLLLAHSQEGMPEYYSQRNYVSIALASLKADSVCLTVNTYDGLAEKTFPLRP